jgi:hypothetical protein
VIRLVGSLLMVVITAGGYMYLDFKMSSRWASSEDAEGLTLTEYLGGLSGRIGGLGGSASASGLPTRLADMLPKPPEGWTVRPTVAEDIEGFLPKDRKKVDKKALSYVQKMAVADSGKGVEAVALTYEKGDRKVVIKAVRYPNFIFTSFMAMQQRFELQMRAAEYRGTEFMSVRGLDVTEDLLPEGFRARYFLADVGAQIHLRVMVPKRMGDRDLVPFFETLQVKAMNASVIDKTEGLGEVPVIVLASELDEAARADYVATLAEREARDAAASAEALKEAEAKAAEEAADDKAGGGLFGGLFGGGDASSAEVTTEGGTMSIDCDKGKDGVKRCKVETVVEE